MVEGTHTHKHLYQCGPRKSIIILPSRPSQYPTDPATEQATLSLLCIYIYICTYTHTETHAHTSQRPNPLKLSTIHALCPQMHALPKHPHTKLGKCGFHSGGILRLFAPYR